MSCSREMKWLAVEKCVDMDCIAPKSRSGSLRSGSFCSRGVRCAEVECSREMKRKHGAQL